MLAETIDRPGGRGLGPITVADVLRGTAAASLVGAAVVHLANAPAHLDESATHGAFFLLVGWAQLTLAAGVASRPRPARGWFVATAAVNVAVMAVWLASRTVGLPGTGTEGVGLPDVLATAMEATAVAAVVAHTRAPLGRRLPRRRVVAAGGMAAVAAVAAVSASVTPSFGHAHGDHDGHGQAHGVASAHDHGTTAGATPGDWDEARLAALEGHLPAAEVERFKEVEREFLAEQILRRSPVLGGLPSAEREERLTTYVEWAVDNALTVDGASVGQEGMHSHAPAPWRLLTDPADQAALQSQLVEAGAVVDRFPTVAQAEAAGYVQVSPYVPGFGAHWIDYGALDGEFDPAVPEMLLFNGHDQGSELVGLSYAVLGPEPPAGFVGDNDTWHNHPTQCAIGNFIVGNEGTPVDLCESIGGTVTSDLAALWMGHLWQVPGWESPWGLFSAENPSVNAATSDLLGPR